MRIQIHSSPITSFATISLTDIIFLLLVFFLLSSTFVLQPGIKVQLPTIISQDISSEKSIIISITKDGIIYLNDEVVNSVELGSKVRRMVLDVGNPIIVLRADKAVIVDKLVEVMDIAKVAGAEKFVIASVPKQ
jgi:biopolymer transport protein ExbD